MSSANKFDPNKDIPDLSGKVYVVTGGSAGIGFGICAHLLQHGCAKLYLVGSNEEHITEALEDLKAYGNTENVHPVKINLADLANTASVAQDLAATLSQLDALILNAGLGVGPYSQSKDGIETHMQVNVIAQHHLTKVLLPLLVRTPDSRLVYQSSEFHRLLTGDVQFASMSEINSDVGGNKRYARTKLAQVLLMRALVQRKTCSEMGLQPGRAPWILATHPGAVMTGQQEQAVEAYGTLGKLGVKAVRPFMKGPVDEGCRSALFAATSDNVVTEALDGVYIVPDRKVMDVSKQAMDQGLQERCWELIEAVLEEKLGQTAQDHA